MATFERSRFQLVSLHTMVSEPLEPVNWAVESLIACGSRVVLYGEFGSLKSWLLLDLALHLAAGIAWLGFPVPRRLRVLYLDEEMGARRLRRRVKRLADGLSISYDGLEFCAVSGAGIRFGEATGEDLLSFVREQYGFEPDVVIVETFRRVLVGSEIEAKDVGSFWRAIDPLWRENKTFIVSHHMKKPSRQGGNDNRNRASGSTDILAGADTAIAIEIKTLGKTVTLECTKSRDAEESPRFTVKLAANDPDGPATLMRCDQESEQDSGESGRAMAQAETFVPVSEAVKRAALLLYLMQQGFKKRTAERAITALVRTGRLLPTGRRGWWQRPSKAEASAA